MNKKAKKRKTRSYEPEFYDDISLDELEEIGRAIGYITRKPDQPATFNLDKKPELYQKMKTNTEKKTQQHSIEKAAIDRRDALSAATRTIERKENTAPLIATTTTSSHPITTLSRPPAKPIIKRSIPVMTMDASLYESTVMPTESPPETKTKTEVTTPVEPKVEPKVLNYMEQNSINSINSITENHDLNLQDMEIDPPEKQPTVMRMMELSGPLLDLCSLPPIVAPKIENDQHGERSTKSPEEPLSYVQLPSKSELEAISTPTPPPPVSLNPVLLQLESQQRYPLQQYCMSLPLNYHAHVTDALVRHINAYNRDVNYPTRLVLLTGAAGAGKTFSIRRACELAGYDTVDIDAGGSGGAKRKKASIQRKRDLTEDMEVKKKENDIESCIRQSLSSPPDFNSPNANKRIKVAIIDAIDTLDASQIGRLRKIIRNDSKPIAEGDDEKKSQKNNNAKKKKKTSTENKSQKQKIKIRYNFIVLVSNHRYGKNMNEWLYKLKVPEITLNNLDQSQTNALVRKACEYLNMPMNAKVYQLIQLFGNNLTALLTRLEWLNIGGGHLTNDMALESLKMDDTEETNIFESGRKILEPTSDGSFAEYETIWEKSGEFQKMYNIVYNSYLSYVQFVPETPTPSDTVAWNQLLQDYPQDRSRVYQGLQSLSQIAHIFSETNTVMNKIPEEVCENYMQFTLKSELQDIFARAVKNRQLDIKTFYTNPDTTCLSKCMINSREAEKLWYVSTLRNIEARKKLKDIKYEPQLQYELSENIGHYYSLVNDERNEWVDLDIFAEDKSTYAADEKKRAPDSSKKAKKDPTNNTHPKMQCIKIFSHGFVPENVVTSTARVKLPNGQFLEKKARARKISELS
jgi:hypothetical protein